MARATASRRSAPLRSLPATTGMLLRRLRAELPLAAVVLGVVALTALVFAAFPRMFNRMSDSGLRYAIAHAQVYERNLYAMRGDRIAPGPGNDVFAPVDAAGASFQQQLPDSVRSLIDHRTYVVDSARYRVPLPLGQPAAVVEHVTLRYQGGIDQHTQLVEGRLPQHTDATYVESEGRQAPVPVIEVAMSRQTAEALNLKLGNTVPLEPDPDDRLNRASRSARPQNYAIELVGFISLNDPENDYWYNDPRYDPPDVYDDGQQVQIYATALIAPNAYGDVLNDTNPSLANYTWRYYVDPSRFDAGQVSRLTSDLKRLDAQYGAPYIAPANSTAVSTQLTALLRTYLTGRHLTESILSLAVIGLLAIAFAVIGLVAAFIAERRREMVALVRGRGASASQLLTAQVAEGLLLAVPAGIIGFLLSTLLIRARPNPWSSYAVLSIVVMTTLLLFAAAWPFARRRLAALERPDIVRQRFSPRRAVLETFVVVLAALGIYLLRRRGLAGDSSTAERGGFDPYLAAVPVLLGLATGLVALRLYVIPVRLLAWYASFRRDLVPFLGFRRIARQSATTSVPLLVLLLAIAVSVFSSVMLRTIEYGQVHTSWERVGADYRIDAAANTTINPRLDLSGVKGVEATAGAYRKDGIPVLAGDAAIGQIQLLAVDPPAFQRVNAGTPVDPHLPGALLTKPSDAGLGNATNPIPAIVSRAWVGSRPLNPGNTFTLDIERQRLTFVATDVRDRFTGFPANTPFVVTSLPSIQATDQYGKPDRTTIYLRAPASARPAIAKLLDQEAVLTTLTSRAAEYDDVHDAPLVAGAVSGFRLGIAIAAFYSALAVVVALALTGRSRQRDIAYLRTLGLSARQIVGLTVAEQAPPVVLSLVVGTALGVAVARLIEPGLDFTAFTGPDIAVGLQIDWFAVALLAAGLVLTVAAAIAVVGYVAERANMAGTLRLGEE